MSTPGKEYAPEQLKWREVWRLGDLVPDVWAEKEVSIVVLEWMLEGVVEGRVESVKTILTRRFPAEDSTDLFAALDGQKDLIALDRWFDAALKMGTCDEVRAAWGLTIDR